MNKVLISALVCSAILSASSAFAESGKVNFKGNILDNACEVTTDTKDQTVVLGDVAKTEFNNAVGVTAAPKAFDIKLQNCPDATTIGHAEVAVRFDGTEEGNGYLKLGSNGATSAATGVAIAIYNRADNSPVKLYEDSKSVAIDYAGGAQAGTATVPFIARYISTSETVTAGQADSTALFTISYLN